LADLGQNRHRKAPSFTGLKVRGSSVLSILTGIHVLPKRTR